MQRESISSRNLSDISLDKQIRYLRDVSRCNISSQDSLSISEIVLRYRLSSSNIKSASFSERFSVNERSRA